MVEPVGNQPRKRSEKTGPSMAAISGNSHKEREAEAVTEAEREPVEKIIEGKVITRKTPWYKRLTRTMVAEDAGTVGEYIVIDVIVPAAKNLIVEIGTQALERIMFGTTNGRLSRRSPLGASLRNQVNYSRASERDIPLRRPTMSREARARHDFNEIVLETRSEAEEVVAALIDRIARYGSVSVYELYELVGVTGSFADQRWGWDDLVTADVRQVYGGFLLDLPAPEPVR